MKQDYVITCINCLIIFNLLYFIYIIISVSNYSTNCIFEAVVVRVILNLSDCEFEKLLFEALYF